MPLEDVEVLLDAQDELEGVDDALEGPGVGPHGQGRRALVEVDVAGDGAQIEPLEVLLHEGPDLGLVRGHPEGHLDDLVEVGLRLLSREALAVLGDDAPHDDVEVDRQDEDALLDVEEVLERLHELDGLRGLHAVEVVDHDDEAVRAVLRAVGLDGLSEGLLDLDHRGGGVLGGVLRRRLRRVHARPEPLGHLGGGPGHVDGCHE